MTNDVQSTILETIPASPEEARLRVRSLIARNARDEAEAADFREAVLAEVVCPDCLGDGGEMGYDLDERGRSVRVPCGNCDGTGMVKP
jgi:DnaJ-class molecular chaperone